MSSKQEHPIQAMGFWLFGFLRSEEHTSELQSQSNLVCRLLLEKKNHHALTPLDKGYKTVHRPGAFLLDNDCSYTHHHFSRCPRASVPMLNLLHQFLEYVATWYA